MDEPAPSDQLPVEPTITSVRDVVRQVTAVAQRYLGQIDDPAIVELGEKVIQRLKEFAKGETSLQDLNNALHESDRLPNEVVERTEAEVSTYLERVVNGEFTDDFSSKETSKEAVAVVEEEPAVAEERPHPVDDSFMSSMELVPYEEGEGPAQMIEERPQGRDMHEYSFADICDMDFTKCKDLHNVPMKYVNVLGQVIKVFHTPRSTAIRFWDGHMLKYSKLPNLKLFLADEGMITQVLAPALPELEDIPSDYYMDIFLYGQWIEESKKLRSGDIICISNLHMSLPKTCRMIQPVLHEGNSHGRNIRLLSSEDAASDQMVQDLLVTAASLRDTPQESPPLPRPQPSFIRAADLRRQEHPVPKQQPPKRPVEKQTSAHPSSAQAADPPTKKTKMYISPSKKRVAEIEEESLRKSIALITEDSKKERLRRSVAAALEVDPAVPSTSRKERLRRSVAEVLGVDPDVPSSSKAANHSENKALKENQPAAVLLDDNVPIILPPEVARPVEQIDRSSPQKNKSPRAKLQWNLNPTEKDLKDLDDAFSSIFGCVPIKELPTLPVADDSPIDVLADSMEEEDVVVLRHHYQETAEAGVQTEVRSSTTATQTVKSPPKKNKGVQVVVEEERPATTEMAVQTDAQIEPPVASPRREPSRSPRRNATRNTVPPPAEPSPRRNPKRASSSATKRANVKQELMSPPPLPVRHRPATVPPASPIVPPVPPHRQNSLLLSPSRLRISSLRKRPSNASPVVEQKPLKAPTPPKRARLSRSTEDAPPPPPHRNLRSTAAGATTRGNQVPAVQPPVVPGRSSSRLSAGASVAVKEEKPFAKRNSPQKKAKNPVTSSFCRTPQINVRPTIASSAKERGKGPAAVSPKRRK